MLYLDNAKNNFAAANGVFGDNEESRFYHKIALMISNRVSVDGLILAFKLAFADAERKGENVLAFITLVPRYVDQFENIPFALEFRKKYNDEILGLSIADVPDEDYGCVIIDPGLVDISGKDRGAVLAKLYNYSTPTGAGLLQYDPMEWTDEMGRFYFEHFAEERDDGSIYFSYIKGRALHVTFMKDNIVFVKAYNQNNGFGLAEKLIASIPDKTLDEQVLKK